MKQSSITIVLLVLLGFLSILLLLNYFLTSDQFSSLAKWLDDEELLAELKRNNIIYWELLDPSGEIIDKGGKRSFTPPLVRTIRVSAGSGKIFYLRLYSYENRRGNLYEMFLKAFLPFLWLMALVFFIVFITLENKKLKEMKKEIERQKQLVYLGEVSRGLAHELRNPLNTISMNFQMIEDEFPADSPIGVRLSRIKRELARLEENLTNYLRFARPPKPQLKREELNSIVENTAKFFMPECAEKEIELKLELGHGLSPVIVDEKQIQQALLNILRNAKEASPNKEKITIKTGEEGSFVFVSVSDRGKGIPKDELEKIFDPYFTKRPDGSGIGLAVVKRIIEEHSGKVKVSSEPGQGTTFILYFPKAKRR